MPPSRYEQAGVSIDAQDQAIQNIKSDVKSTATSRVLSEIGSFGGLFDIRFPEMTNPVLVASADGVGTKLKVAFDAGKHDTVGQCLVNHCINDILVQGAKPLFFMDYIATGKLKPGVVGDILAGMAVACRESELAILGGEMAEMPGFYQTDEYDVAGFIVGVVDRTKILGEKRVQKGQKIVGLKSSGLHTNGYSLARKIVFEEAQLQLHDKVPGSEQTVVDALLAVHRPYYKTVATLLQSDHIQAMAHITGGGFLDNVPRVLPKHLNATIAINSYPVPPLFKFLVEKGEVTRDEAYRVFNMGIGMMLFVEPEHMDHVQNHLREQGEEPVLLGDVVDGTGIVTLV
ncbi:MAG: phosphoribosylformylglycinamidine cyclo-ligase [Acidobacteria bacterium]|nr:phosphoribosylformylglycinamidine cyclo-ligase [Acidobacteriota bacterium]